jgi:hypothetical protein
MERVAPEDAAPLEASTAGGRVPAEVAEIETSFEVHDALCRHCLVLYRK